VLKASNPNSISYKNKEQFFFDGIDCFAINKQKINNNSLSLSNGFSISFCFSSIAKKENSCIFDFQDNLKLSIGKNKNYILQFCGETISLSCEGLQEFHSIIFDVENKSLTWFVNGQQKINQKNKNLFFDFDEKIITLGCSSLKKDFSRFYLHYFAFYDFCLTEEQQNLIFSFNAEKDLRANKDLPGPQHFWFPTKDLKIRDTVRKSEKSVIDFEIVNFDKDNFGNKEYKKLISLFPRKFLTNSILDLSNNKTVESTSKINENCLIKFNLNQIDEFNIKRLFKHIPNYETEVKFVNYQDAETYVKNNEI